jgi:hypothetical protein
MASQAKHQNVDPTALARSKEQSEIRVAFRTRRKRTPTPTREAVLERLPPGVWGDNGTRQIIGESLDC